MLSYFATDHRENVWDVDVRRNIIMWVNYCCVALLQVVSAIKFINEKSDEKNIWKAEILDKSLTRHCSSPTGINENPA